MQLKTNNEPAQCVEVAGGKIDTCHPNTRFTANTPLWATAMQSIVQVYAKNHVAKKIARKNTHNEDEKKGGSGSSQRDELTYRHANHHLPT